jgi:hypothetical protein
MFIQGELELGWRGGDALACSGRSDFNGARLGRLATTGY